MNSPPKKWTKFWMVAFTLIMVIYLGIFILLFKSGIFADIQLPDLFSRAEASERYDDPRVVAYEVGNDSGWIDRFSDGIRQLFGEENTKGHIKVKSIDKYTKKGIKGMTFNLKNAYTDAFIEEIITDENGIGISKELPLNKSYYVEPKETVTPYPLYGDTVYLKLTSKVMKVTLKHRMSDNVDRYEITSNGEVKMDTVDLEVPIVLQNPELPNGCEITAATALLQFYHYDVTKVNLSDVYLKKEAVYKKDNQFFGPDPNKAFAGDPKKQDGWYSYVGPTLNAINAYMKNKGGAHIAIDKTGWDESDILLSIAKGKPVAVWVTRDMKLANYDFGWYLNDHSGLYYRAVTNLHVVVVTGYSTNNVRVMDPLKGRLYYDKTAFFKAYESLGKKAIVIEEVNG